MLNTGPGGGRPRKFRSNTRRNRSQHHVQRVIARILSKRNIGRRDTSTRCSDFENEHEDWRWH